MAPTETTHSLNRISKTWRNEPDRSAAILGATLLDELLGKLLRGYLRDDKKTAELFNVFGPLSSFAARIGVCYALGLIPKDVYDDLGLIRKIRNEFAHKIEGAEFEAIAIAKLVDRLYVPKWFFKHLPFSKAPPPDAAIKDIKKRPRRRFELTVAVLSFSLDKYIREIKRIASKSLELPDIT